MRAHGSDYRPYHFVALGRYSGDTCYCQPEWRRMDTPRGVPLPLRSARRMAGDRRNAGIDRLVFVSQVP